MAEVLSLSKASRGPHGLWALDKLLLVYLAAAGALVLAYWTAVPDAASLLAVHLVSAVLILLAAQRQGRLAFYFRHWYPLPLISFFYREMSLLIPPIWGRSFDGALADLDFAIWHANPTVWLERIQTPNLTEFLQIAYALFVPAVLLPPAILWAKGRFRDFRYGAFLIAFGFVASYAGYLLVPARGPRFLLAPLQHHALEGRWFFHWTRSALDRLESAHYDCFPSGHTELTILAWWISRQISKKLGWTYFFYTLCIIFATVYLRYHYTVDVMAGALLAAWLIWKAPMAYRRLGGKQGREDTVGT